jgi:transposase InsO family protein
VKSSQTNGFIERFNKTVLDEFFRIAFRASFYESVEALQEDLDQWLIHYNTERLRRATDTEEKDHSIPFWNSYQMLDMSVSYTS